MADTAAKVALAKQALRLRLQAGAPHILGSAIELDSYSTAELLAFLSSCVRREADRAKFWLLMTCVAGAMPTREELVRGYRLLELSREGAEHFEVLHACAGMAGINPNFTRALSVVDRAIVADVDFCARYGHNTGVQRVVRETVKRWASTHDDLSLAAWSEDGLIMRTLISEERTRVLDWTSLRRPERSLWSAEDSAEFVVPWNSTLLLPEVAQHRFWERLACMAEFSSNTVSMVGYDAIPVTSAEYVIPSETDRFVRYLSVVKHSDLVVGISGSSSEEFAGFVSALGSQGLSGPTVTTVSLPVALASPEDDIDGELESLVVGDLPLILCVGTQEPRKNQLAVLAAAERLWQEGLRFEMLFFGGAAMPLSLPFDAEVDRLQKLGRPITVKRNGSDLILEHAYRTARFSVFVSLHEGYGLPIGESLAAGTPVVSTRYGSMAEIALDGGCIVVDPRDDVEIATAMRLLLTDDVELSRLTEEASRREHRTWDDYAAELWDVMTNAGVAK